MPLWKRGRPYVPDGVKDMPEWFEPEGATAPSSLALAMIDTALADISGQSIVSTKWVKDVLLDLRLLLSSQSQP